MSKKRLYSAILMLVAPFAGWLCLTWFFASTDAFNAVFAHGTPMDKSSNLFSIVFSGGGVFFSLLVTIFAAESLIESFDKTGGWR